LKCLSSYELSSFESFDVTGGSGSIGGNRSFPMSDITDIQWADTTVNPFMGCAGCELFPPPGKVLEAIDAAVADTGVGIDSRLIYKELVQEAYAKIPNPKPGHKNAVNTTNIWHLRTLFLAQVKRELGKETEAAAEKAIRQSITCYAATLHLNRGLNLLKPDYEGKEGYAPIFERLTKFDGRSMKTARLNDLLGMTHPETPWKNGLARLIFVSDMGDSLSRKADFPFLKSDLITAITSDDGKRHLWLWLTKRPGRMAEFAEEIGGFPENVCAMTTLTGPDPESLERLADLKKVKARVRGLSIEPLWKRIPPSKLNLKGIDWVILGGESGSGLEFTRPFALEWAEELRDHCRKNGVAFFLKQLGRNLRRICHRAVFPYGTSRCWRFRLSCEPVWAAGWFRGWQEHKPSA
jgi:protein gp37